MRWRPEVRKEEGEETGKLSDPSLGGRKAEKTRTTKEVCV